MEIYRYDSVTREYVGTEEAFEDPKRPGRIVLHPFTTEIQPPTCNQNEVAVFEDTYWVVEEDYRGTYWDTTTFQEVRITNIGELPGANLSKFKPVQEISNEEIIKQQLSSLDLPSVRILEDIISILNDHYNIDIFSHLPPEARSKILQKQDLREQLNNGGA